MKALFCLIVCCAAILMISGCGKDDSAPTSNTNTGGNNNGSTGNLKITGWTPEHPYHDEIITIRGTGFSDDDTANHVGMKRFGNYTRDLEVLSATPTELRVRIPLTDSSYLSTLEDFLGVRVGSTKAYAPAALVYHAPLRILDVSTPSGYLYKAIVPDKQVWLQVQGFNPAEGPAHLALTGGTNGLLTIDSVEYSEASQQSTVWCSVPADLMEPAPVPWKESLCDSEYVNRQLIVTANERTDSRLTRVFLLPRTRIDSISPNAVSINDLNGVSQSGGQMFLTIHGSSLYGVVSCPELFPDQIIGTYTEKFGVQIGGLGWKVPAKGTYNIRLGQKDCDGGGLAGPTVGQVIIY